MVHHQAYQHIFHEILKMRKEWDWEIAGKKINEIMVKPSQVCWIDRARKILGRVSEIILYGTIMVNLCYCYVFLKSLKMCNHKT